MATLLSLVVALASVLGVAGPASAAAPASITGVVTGPDGQPLEGVEVRPYYYDEDDDFWYRVPWTYVLSGPDGSYDLGPLDPGTYRLGFTDYSGHDCLDEFWDDAATVDDATDITVSTDHVNTGKNARLAAGSEISGTVTGPDAKGVDEIEVRAYRWDPGARDWDPTQYAYTDGAGSYEIRGLRSGTYRLSFDDVTGGEHLTEWWDDAASLETATDVAVPVDTTVSAKDAELATPSTPPITNTGPPTISGSARAGSTLTAAVGTWSPSTGLAFTYRWLVAGQPVSAATAATYRPTTDDIGKTVQVRVRATRSGHTAGTATSAATPAVGAPPPTVNRTPPAIGTPPQVGAIVTATPGTWDPAAATFAYQWLVAGSPVAGATTASYTPVAADAGKTLRVRVTATATGYTAATAASATTTVGKGTLRVTKKPKVTGKVKKNATLKVSPGTWSPAGRATFQWYSGTKAIKKATTAKLKLSGKTLKTVRGKAISVVVTVTAPGYTTVTTTLKVAGKVR
jgi:hypothetical protein